MFNLTEIAENPEWTIRVSKEEHIMRIIKQLSMFASDHLQLYKS